MKHFAPFWKPLPLLGAGVAVLVALGVGVGLLARSVGGDDTPPAVPPFSGIPTPVPAFDVSSVEGATVSTANAGPLRLDPGARVETLRPAAASSFAPGDGLVVIGVPNEVKNLAIRAIVDVPGAVAGPDGLPRSPAGFTGSEASRSPNERAVAGGTISDVQGNTITVDGPQGTLRIELDEGAVLMRLAAGTPADIVQGVRVAIAGEPGAVRGVLVSP